MYTTVAELKIEIKNLEGNNLVQRCIQNPVKHLR